MTILRHRSRQWESMRQCGRVLIRASMKIEVVIFKFHKNLIYPPWDRLKFLKKISNLKIRIQYRLSRAILQFMVSCHLILAARRIPLSEIWQKSPKNKIRILKIILRRLREMISSFTITKPNLTCLKNLWTLISRNRIHKDPNILRINLMKVRYLRPIIMDLPKILIRNKQ